MFLNITNLKKQYKKLIGNPTAQIHNSPKRLFSVSQLIYPGLGCLDCGLGHLGLDI